MMRLLSSGLVALVCLSVLGVAQQATEVRSYDLSLCVARELEQPRRPISLLLVESDRVGDRGNLDTRGVGLEPDTIVELLRNTVSPDTWDEEGNQINVRGGRLWVSSRDRSLLDRIGRAVVQLEAAVHRPIQVEVHCLPASTHLRAGPLDAKAAVSLLSGSVHPVGSFEILPRSRSSFRVGTLSSFLSDYDVEVASKSSIADPRVATVQDGQDLSVECYPTPSGRFIVRAVCRRSTLEGMSLRPSHSSALGAIQVPRIRTMIAAGSGVLQNGGALVLGISAETGDGFLVLRIRSLAQGPSLVGSARLIPVGVADAGTMVLPHAILPGPTASGESDAKEREEDESESLAIDSFMESIRQSVGPEAFEREQSFMSYAAGFLCVSPSDLAEKTAKAFGGIQGALLKTVGLEFCTGTLPLAEASALVSATNGRLGVVAKSLGTRAYVSSVPGDDFRLVLGRETHYMKDHDVEIAQEAVIADPIVATLFTGQALGGRLRMGSSDRLLFEGEFLAQVPVGSVVSFDGSADDVGVIDLPKTTTWRQPLSVTLRSGDWTLMGIAPLPGHDQGLVVLARATF